MSSKKFINDPVRCVDDSIEGFLAINTSLRKLEGHRVVLRGDLDSLKQARKVTLLCGGGSGHEPAHTGFIGPGMLTAVVCGSVFASPPSASVLAGLRQIAKGNPAGSLVLVKNYTGDRIHFGLAVERAKAEGLKVEMVVVGEDCALMSSDKTTGRRGLCGGIFVHKVLGAMAEEGRSLEEISATAESLVSSMGTIGLSLGPCCVPGAGYSFQLGPDEMELGLGIHGEPGVSKVKMMSAAESVAAMLDHMTASDNLSRLDLQKGENIALMVNNLGGISVLELGIVCKEAIQQLETRGFKVDRAYSGTLMSSLEMPAVSLTVLKLSSDWLECLDVRTDAPAWPLPYSDGSERFKGEVTLEQEQVGGLGYAQESPELSEDGAKLFSGCLLAVSESLIQSEAMLNLLDQGCGDGDTGQTMAQGASVLRDLVSSSSNVSNPHRFLLELSAAVEQKMGGTSGGLYSLFLSAAAGSLKEDVGFLSWIKALQKGNEAIRRYGHATEGDRTMLDTLMAAERSLMNDAGKKSPEDCLTLAAEVAVDASLSTRSMRARAGRASYVSDEHLANEDPGAKAAAVWISALAVAVKTSSTQ